MWLLLALLACDDGGPAPDDTDTDGVCDFPALEVGAPSPRAATDARPEVAALAATVNALTADVMNELPVTADNVAFSSLSLVGMFSTLLPGADAATAASLAEILRIDQDLSLHHAALSSLLGDLDDTDRGWGFGWGTSFWHRPSLTPAAPWLAEVQGLYGLTATPVDFQGDPEGARTAINAWVSEHTRCLIPEFYPPGYDFSLKVHIAIHAMGLEAKWERPFDAYFTGDGTFTLADGSTTTATFMRHEGFAGSVRHADGLTRLRLPYLGGDLAMYLVMPDTPVDPATLLVDADAASFAAWADLPREGNLAIQLPKWTTLSTHELLPGPLDTLGYTPLVNLPLPDVCDGCAMPNIVRQVVVVLVDEEGTRAAAATSGETDDSEPAWTVVDRPFLWFLRDDASGAVLWTGLVRDPSK